MRKINVFYDLRVDIEGAVMQWENHTCLISNISQIWIGTLNERKWVFMKDTDQEGLNVELNSGSIHSFVSDDKEFLIQAYELLCSIVIDRGCEGMNTIDFEHNELLIYEEPEEILEPETVVVSSNIIVNPVKRELNILVEHCKKKENMGTAVIQLLEDICNCYDGSCKSNLQDLYKMFIQLTLVNDCNELGLNLLLEEVKMHVYGQ